MTIKHRNYTIFTWSRGKHGTVTIRSRLSGRSYFWYFGIKWVESTRQTDPAVAITYDPLEAVNPI